MSIKVAMHNWMRPEPIERTIERLGRLGYDGLEISGEPQGFDVEHVRGLLSEHGVECWGAVTLMMGGRDLLHEDPYVRLGSVQYVKDCLTFVSELEGKILTIVPSTVGKIVPMGSAADEWRWCVEALKECQEHAESVGVRIGLEPLNRFETYFLNRCEQALALVDAVGGDIGVALDAFHMNIEEADLLAAIRAAGDRLVDFHVADNNRMPPGHGALDWTAIVRATFDPPSGKTAEAPTLINAQWDSSRRILSEFSRGRGMGDCGMRADYGWDGVRLRLVRREAMSECLGARSFVTTWRARVVRP